MFQNIEKGILKMPTFLSPQAKDLIQRLLKRKPFERLGAGPFGAKEVKQHHFFEGLDWDDVLQKKTYPPFKKKKAIKREHFSFSEYVEDMGNLDDNYVPNWSFIR